MHEIKYDLIDPISGLIIKPWTDHIIRQLADMHNSTPAEELKKTKDRLNQAESIHYSVNKSGCISPMPRNTRVRDASSYFDDYEDALTASRTIKEKL